MRMRKLALPAALSALPIGVRQALWLLLPLAPLVTQLCFELRAPVVSAADTSAPTLTEGMGTGSVSDIRFELLASLDLFVRAEQVIQKETGSFTAALGRMPDVLGPVVALYRIEVPRASRNRLLVTAEGAMSSDWVSLTVAQDIARDRVTIDEHGELRANFPLPTPPSGYLRALAQTVMGRIQSEASSVVPEVPRISLWEGVYSGHFSYEIRPRASGGSILVAVPKSDEARRACGGRELPREPESPTIFQWVASSRNQTFGDVAARTRLREIFLAQKTHYVHTGRLAQKFDDLPALWAGLRELHSSDSHLQLDGYAADSAYGYQAEVAVLGDGEQIRNLWSINGYGQTTRINPVEELMGRFEKATKSLDGSTDQPGAGSRAVSSEGPPRPAREGVQRRQ